jgi:hypothetical protein
MKANLNIKYVKVLKVFLFASIFISFNLKHPFYLSVTELKYDSKTKSLQGSVKLFTNDFEEALKKIYNHPVDLINGKDKDAIGKLLTDYLQKHLIIKVAGNEQTFSFIGYEIEEEVIWMHVEYKNCPAPKKLVVLNTLLYDFIKTQTNIVNCDYNSSKKSFKVTCPEKAIRFDF